MLFRSGWIWFWVFLLATSPLVLRTNRYADHALYLPLIGISVVIVDGLSVVLEKRTKQRVWRYALVFLAVGVLGSFSVKTTLRNQDWQDPETFYYSILKYNPKSAAALNNLAVLYDLRGENKKAETFFRRLLEISPGFAEGYSEFGNLLLKQGYIEEAIQAQQKALSLKPDGAEIHHNLASAYRMRGDCEKAVIHYQKALSLKPYLIETHYFLADCYERLSLKEQAQAERAWLLQQRINVIKVKTAP